MSSAKKQKYYVVWEGKKPGIYDNWDECKAQVDGVEKSKYKSFESRAEAESAFKKDYWSSVNKAAVAAKKSPAAQKVRAAGPQWEHSICTDAACAGNPGDMEYRCVVTKTGEQLFHQGPFPEGTNNIGEFLGLVHALAMLKKTGDSTSTIYTDSETAIAWVRNRKHKSTLERTNRNQKVFELLDRAVAWVETNDWKNPILKWETKVWGEIPADFGRK
jgi:ribonuclease HI